MSCARIVTLVWLLLAMACAHAVTLRIPDQPPGVCSMAETPGRVAVGGGAEGRFLIDASYDLGHGSGALHRRAMQMGVDGSVAVGGAVEWDANALLTRGGTQRRIYTATSSLATVPFEWAQLPPPDRALLDTPGVGQAPDGLGEMRVAWLRGEREAEGGPLRARTGILGDIVHSTPLVVGAPSASVRGEAYAAFRARFGGRRSAVLAGANDGMLHAFDAADGTELFAYIPRTLLPWLSALTSPGYRHRPYVDGSPGQGEAVIGGQWLTVLASGMGMGARGVFALDITDSAAFASGRGALWEFTERDDPGIGHVHAPPLIARLRTGERGGLPTYRSVTVVASGINPAHADGALFLLALDKPRNEAWAQGRNYLRIAAPAGDAGQANALSAPVLATAADGSARYAYAGDLQGRLWRFTLGWSGATATLLFTARDSTGHPQPIAHAPQLAFAPGGGYLLLFGTGKFLEADDARPASFVPQSFYAVRDRLAGPVAGRAALAERHLSGSGPYTVTGRPVNYSGDDADDGWYLDFPNARGGERLAGTPVLLDGAVAFDTLQPTGDPCGPPAMRSYLLDALSGMAPDHAGAVLEGGATGEAAPPGSFADTPMLLVSGSIAAAAASPTGAVAVTRTVALVHVRAGAGGAIAASSMVRKVALKAGRLSWREVANWQELHNARRR